MMNWDWISRWWSVCRDVFTVRIGLHDFIEKDMAAAEAKMTWAFGKAKNMSDFIGMVVQLTCLIVFILYFFGKASATTSWWLWYIDSTIMAFGLVFVYGILDIAQAIARATKLG
jgi:hypothetical protein